MCWDIGLRHLALSAKMGTLVPSVRPNAQSVPAVLCVVVPLEVPVILAQQELANVYAKQGTEAWPAMRNALVGLRLLAKVMVCVRNTYRHPFVSVIRVPVKGFGQAVTVVFVTVFT